MANHSKGDRRRGGRGRTQEAIYGSGDLAPDTIRNSIIESGCIRLDVAALSKLSGIGQPQVRKWLRGDLVSARVDMAMREILMLPENPQASADAAPFKPKNYREYAEAQQKEIAVRPRKRGPYKKHNAA